LKEIFVALLILTSTATWAASPDPGAPAVHHEAQNRFRSSWIETFQAIENLNLTERDIFTKPLKKDILEIEVQTLPQLNKPQFANRFSAFYFENKPLIIFNSEEAANSNPVRYCLLSTHEGLSLLKFGDRDGVFSVYLCMAKDILKNNEDLPKTLSPMVLKNALALILTSDAIALRAPPTSDFYRWDSNLDNQQILVPENFQRMGSGTFVGGGGDGTLFEFLRMTLYKTLEIFAENLGESDLEKIYGADKAMVIAKTAQTVFRKTAYYSIRCEVPDPLRRPIIYWPKIKENEGVSWAFQEALTVLAEENVSINKSVKELIYYRSKSMNPNVILSEHISTDSILLTSYEDLIKLSKQRRCKGFPHQIRPLTEGTTDFKWHN